MNLKCQADLLVLYFLTFKLDILLFAPSWTEEETKYVYGTPDLLLQKARRVK